MRERLVNAEIVSDLLNQLAEITQATNAPEVELIILRTLSSIGFSVARLYYLNDNQRLVLTRCYSPDDPAEEYYPLLDGPERVVLPLRHDNVEDNASYAVLSHGIPLVVKVSPKHKAVLQPRVDRDDINFIQIQKAPFQSEFERPDVYEWIDFPLVVDGVCFGKITLEKDRGSTPVTSHDYNVLNLLVKSISNFISSAGWFGGYKLPEQMVQGFWLQFESVNSVSQLLDMTTRHIRLTLNANSVSLFWIIRPIVPRGVALEQPERLVLWSTTYTNLKQHERKVYYEKGEGLTGGVWASGSVRFVENLKECSSWTGGKYNDSNEHDAYVAAPILSPQRDVVGVVRIPEGRQHRLLKQEATMLQLFSSTVVAPAVANFIKIRNAAVRDDLLSCFNCVLAKFQSHERSELADQLWAFAVEACEAAFGSRDKKSVVYSLREKSFVMEQMSGDLRRSPEYEDVEEIPLDTHSAVAKVLATGEPMFLTDVQGAAKQQAYIPLISDVKCAIIVPLVDNGVPFGMLSVVSANFDLLPERDLQVLQLISAFCSTLQEISRVASAVREDERRHLLETAAYLVKAPAMQLNIAQKQLREEMDANRFSTSALASVQSAAVWLHNTADRILHNVHNHLPIIHKQRISVDELFGLISENLQSHLATENSKNIQLEVQSGHFPGRCCYLDVESILSAVFSGFDNARKASPVGGKVVFTLLCDGREIAVRIRDQGNGCDPTLLEKIFEPSVHYQFTIGNKEPPDTGFGLVVVDSIVRLHGGRRSAMSDGQSYFELEMSFPLGTSERHGNEETYPC